MHEYVQIFALKQNLMIKKVVTKYIIDVKKQ